MHCTMEELLAVRDGEGSLSARRHLDDCEECVNELELIHQRVAALKALPAARPPRDRWSAISTQIRMKRRAGQRRLVMWASAAAAASLLLTAGVELATMHQPNEQDDELTQLIAEAEALEESMRFEAPKLRVVDARTAGAIAVLEDELFDLERQVAVAGQLRSVSRGELVTLWEERVKLMDVLLEVKRGRVSYVGF